MRLLTTVTRRTQHFINNPKRMITKLLMRYYPRIVSDKWYVQHMWERTMDYPLDLKNPLTFNEKLNWLKFNDHNPIYHVMADKYAVKEYMSKLIGPEYVTPVLAVFQSVDDIDLSKLPSQFVLKCNHDCGSVVICKDKSTFNIENAKKFLNTKLHSGYYGNFREWSYKDIEPCIIAEPYLCNGEDLKDYKFFCFNGKVRCFKIDFDRYTNHRANYYDVTGQILPFGEKAYPPDYSRNLEMPTSLPLMISLAEKISQNIPFVRVDFYDLNGNVRFGECTFFPIAGMGRYTDKAWDYKLGEWLDLTKVSKK